MAGEHGRWARLPESLNRALLEKEKCREEKVAPLKRSSEEKKSL